MLHALTPGTEVRVILLGGLQLEHSCKVDRDQRSNIGNAELVGSNKLAVCKMLIQIVEKGCRALQASLGKCRNLFDRPCARKPALGHGRVAVTKGLGHSAKSILLNARLPIRHIALVFGRAAQQGGLGKPGFKVGSNGGVVGKAMAVFIHEGRHRTPGVDRPKSIAELFKLTKVDGHFFIVDVFLSKEDARTAGVWC